MPLIFRKLTAVSKPKSECCFPSIVSVSQRDTHALLKDVRGVFGLELGPILSFVWMIKCKEGMDSFWIYRCKFCIATRLLLFRSSVYRTHELMIRFHNLVWVFESPNSIFIIVYISTLTCAHRSRPSWARTTISQLWLVWPALLYKW